MDQLNELLTASSPLLIAVAMTILGKVLKMTPCFPDKFIPLGLCVAGAIGYMGIESFTYRNGILGFTIGGMSVCSNQIWRQFVGVKADPETPKPEPQPLNPL